MKLISQAEQKKINLQIENLQKKVTELEAQLASAKAAHKKLEASSAKTIAEAEAKAAQANEELLKSKAEFSKAKSESAKAIDDAAKAEAEAKAKIATTQAQLDAATKQGTEATQENEILLSQLMQVQEELEKFFLEKKQAEADLAKVQIDAAAQLEAQQKVAKQFEAVVAQLRADQAAVNADLAAAQQELAIAREQLAHEQHAKNAAEGALSELQAKTPKELKAVTDKYQQQAQTAQALEQELAMRVSELAQAQQALQSVQAESSGLQQAKLELDAHHAHTLSELEQMKHAAAQQAEQYASQLKDATQENELLLTQLMQVQEELESYYLDKTKFEKLYQDIQARWDRLEKRYPNYVDFGSVELVAFDNLSDVPSVTWRVKDYAQGGVAFDEFLFQTVLQDGQPGIGLVIDAKALATVDSALVPKLLKPQSKQLERFVRMGQTEFRKLMAATTIVSQLEASGWRGVALPNDFDLGFWREPLKLLPTQLQSLPVMLRYDAIKLKRELTNPDYEHLWLEFKGMGLGARTWPKFEIRLGAAMVQRGGFSQFPKFEIPLIDGKVKPFESWFAESQDDNGAKLELRFSLEKQVFDTGVWAKLDDVDKALLLRLIYAMPDVLLRLEAEHASIHRPWATWVSFAKAAMLVIEKSRAAAKQMKELPAPEPTAVAKAPVNAPTPAKLPAPSTPSASTKKSISTKPAAKRGAAKKVAKATVASQKTAPAKKTVAVKKAVPVKKPAAAKTVMPVKKAATARSVAAKKPAAAKALTKKIPGSKK